MATTIPRGTSSNLLKDEKLKVGTQLAIPTKDTFTTDEIASIALGSNNRLKVKGNDGTVRDIANLTDVGSSITNLALGTATTTTQPITNSNGTGFTLSEATTSLAGLFSSVDKTKFNTITGGTSGGYVRANGTISTLSTDVRAAALTGVVTTTSSTILAADTLLVGVGKLQAQINTINVRSKTLTGSGDGVLTTITIPHALTGVTTTSILLVTANSLAAGSFIYATCDATNVYIYYTTAPVTGTNNLLYSIYIK